MALLTRNISTVEVVGLEENLMYLEKRRRGSMGDATTVVLSFAPFLFCAGKTEVDTDDIWLVQQCRLVPSSILVGENEFKDICKLKPVWEGPTFVMDIGGSLVFVNKI